MGRSSSNYVGFGLIASAGHAERAAAMQNHKHSICKAAPRSVQAYFADEDISRVILTESAEIEMKSSQAIDAAISAAVYRRFRLSGKILSERPERPVGPAVGYGTRKEVWCCGAKN